MLRRFKHKVNIDRSVSFVLLYADLLLRACHGGRGTPSKLLTLPCGSFQSCSTHHQPRVAIFHTSYHLHLSPRRTRMRSARRRVAGQRGGGPGGQRRGARRHPAAAVAGRRAAGVSRLQQQPGGPGGAAQPAEDRPAGEASLLCCRDCLRLASITCSEVRSSYKFA